LSIELLLIIIIAILLMGPTKFMKSVNDMVIGVLFLLFLGFVLTMIGDYYDDIKAVIDTVGWFIICFYAVMIVIAILLIIYVFYALNKLKEIDDSFLFAIERNDTREALTILQKYKPKVNFIDDSKWTPLMMAARKGNIEIVKALLKKKPNINLKNHSGDNAYTIAKYMGHDHVANMLLKAGANKVKPSYMVLINSIFDHNIEGVRRCLLAGISPMSMLNSKDSALDVAIGLNNKVIISYFLKHGGAPYVSNSFTNVQDMYRSGLYLKYIEDYERERVFSNNR
jgi:Ankyrin repeats (3 copies)